MFFVFISLEKKERVDDLKSLEFENQFFDSVFEQWTINKKKGNNKIKQQQQQQSSKMQKANPKINK